jgi:ribosomal protein L11 methyltransferase
VQLVVALADAEVAADALWQGHPSAVSEVALDDGRVQLTADVTDLACIDRRWPVEVVELDGDAYLDAWRSWAAPQRAGRRILLQPAWLPVVGTSDADLVIRIDPGRSFGSGSHPSTRSVLAALEDAIVGGERVLDLGCGSGVLAIAACLLGAAEAVALDIDPAALDATRANAVTNEVDDRVQASGADLRSVDGPFDVVVANIGVRVLREVAPALVERLRHDGLLVLAGLLDEQVEEVLAECNGCEEVARRGDAGWSTLVLRRSG